MAPVSLELVIPALVCLVLLVAATVFQVAIKQESHPWHRFLRSVRISKYVLSWYIISISFTLCNKWILRYWRGTGFPFPIFVTCMHMTTKFLLTRLINRFLPLEKRIKPLPCRENLRGPYPIGICTAIDVAFSNLSFLFISITFYTILKSGAILWILLWAIILGLEALTWEIIAICGLVSTGVSLASYGEASFSWVGFALVTSACASSGLRWALTQIMLTDGDPRGGGSNMGNSSSDVMDTSFDDSSGPNGGGSNGRRVRHDQQQHPRPVPTSQQEADDNEEEQDIDLHTPSGSSRPPNGDGSRIPPQVAAFQQQQQHLHRHRPLEILYHVSPASALSCVPVFLLLEVQSCFNSPFFKSPLVVLELICILILGGIISFLLVFAEVKLVKISSSLTMSMFGAVKEVITIAISMMVFQENVTFLNVFGLFLAISGAVAFRQYKVHGPFSSSSSSLLSARNGSGGGLLPEYLPAESGLFNLEDSDDEGEGGREGSVQGVEIIERQGYRDVRLT